MTCATVVDSDPSDVGLKASSLTTEQVVGYLGAVLATDLAHITNGKPSATDLTILDAAIQELENYHGDKLADDSEQYVQNAEKYTGYVGYPNQNGPVDPSASSAMQSDIETLMKDCPQAVKVGNLAELVTNGKTAPPAAAQQTDPNGQTCATLDSQGYCPGDDPSPSPVAPTMTRQTDTVVFRVSGTGEPSIQYGTDSSTNNPSDGVGPLGDGNYLPWTASMPYDAGALYYAVTAQLEGSGSIQDSVTEVVTTWCSGSEPKTESFPLASGNASGGYGIATAEYDSGDTGNATQAESDAGC
jgi:hypothetical protein